ncbi:hypothetical protein [Tropicimonas sp. IMCC34011]|uniref:phage protein n=1 Tax=Tropicimonas sp. IMCC34011 TaxID=2248759 RepID=UPI000E23CE06|nr:hypothetical protein [Tropicimonas sp. IMCC34011]
MSLQYLRKVRLTAVGSSGLVINAGQGGGEDLKIGFSVSRSLSSSANDASIQIWNLSEGHRNAMGRELEDVRLEAGYLPPDGDDQTGVIFAGQIREVRHEKQDGDIITTLDCGDGDRALRRADVSKTFPAGTPVQDVIDYVRGRFEEYGVTTGEVVLSDKARGAFARPYSMAGPARREMDRLGRATRSYWSLQNGTFEMIPGDGYIGTILRFDAATGLIGVPTITDNGVSAEVLLNPEIRPGRRVQIVSEHCEVPGEDNIVRVSAVTFAGDNRDGNFIARIEGEAVSGGKVDEGER